MVFAGDGDAVSSEPLPPQVFGMMADRGLSFFQEVFLFQIFCSLIPFYFHFNLLMTISWILEKFQLFYEPPVHHLFLSHFLFLFQESFSQTCYIPLFPALLQLVLDLSYHFWHSFFYISVQINCLEVPIIVNALLAFANKGSSL